MLIYALGFIAVSLSAAAGSGGECGFRAIFNFGDSNSDTGGRSAALREIGSPNGQTYFGYPSGRGCDGRLIIDLIAEELKLPHLDAYLDSLGTSFRHGANFATGGSSVRVGGYSPFHLKIQTNQFLRFKNYVTRIHNHLNHTGLRKSRVAEYVPRLEDFSKGLYTIDIGQNDLAYGFEHTNETLVIKSLPNILHQYSQAILTLYEEGARFFWVHNTGPIGCLPYNVIYDQHKPGNLDRYGCVGTQNKVAQEFNRQLKAKLAQISAKLPRIVFTYVDVYTAKYNLIKHAKKLGFGDPMKFCCGSYYVHHINCGEKTTINGTVYHGNACKDPSKQISWDGIHYTESANRLIARRIVSGSLSHPPRPMSKACQAHREA
uniref:Uncharacterized protein n=1 Tax=Kalanchoe fedtschenkoi TaxID=63787 RepID=A0A7N0UBT4_KALFE